MASEQVDAIRKCLSASGTHATRKEIEDVRKHIDKHPAGHKFVDLISSFSQPQSVRPPTDLGSYQYSVYTTGSLLNLWVYQRVTMNCTVNGTTHNFIGNSGGITPGIPAGALFGTMYYNDPNDFGGDYDFEVGGIAGYFEVVLTRGGSAIMTFQAGNVGASTGVGGGTGSWS